MCIFEVERKSCLGQAECEATAKAKTSSGFSFSGSAGAASAEVETAGTETEEQKSSKVLDGLVMCEYRVVYQQDKNHNSRYEERPEDEDEDEDEDLELRCSTLFSKVIDKNSAQCAKGKKALVTCKESETEEAECKG